MMWGYHGFGGGWTMGLGMVLFWGVIIFVVIGVARGFGTSWSRREDDFKPDRRTAVDMLRERYARGDVDKAEFEEKLRDLRDSGSSS